MDCWNLGDYTCHPKIGKSNCSEGVILDAVTAISETPLTESNFSSFPSIPFQTSKNVKGTFGRFVKTNIEKILPSHSSEQEEASKQFQFQWPKFWEWPPACTTDWDVCSSIPSTTDVQLDKGLCVTLESPARKHETFPVSKDFIANPAFITFRQDASTGTWDDFAWIHVKNAGKISRRINVVQPSHRAFTVVFGATIKAITTVPPGLSTRILIQFTPRSDERISSEVVIRVEGDGAVIVPIFTEPQQAPELEVDDFSCGCILIGGKLIKTFRVLNLGGAGRFWLLPESEFMNEHFGLPVEEKAKVNCRDVPENIEIFGEQDELDEDNEAEAMTDEFEVTEDLNIISEIDEKSKMKDFQDEIQADSGQEEDVEDTNTEMTGVSCIEVNGEDADEAYPPPNTPAEKKRIFKPGQLHVPPFRLSPACFSLKMDQEINIKVSFVPTESKYFHERVAILCDNGEVRWIVLKGLGATPSTSQKLITVQCENWISEGTTTTIDLGDMFSGESLQQNLKISNASSLPVYFRWILQSTILDPLSRAERYAQSQLQVKQRKTSAELVENEGEEPEDVKLIPGIPVTISPEEGFLKGCGEIDCVLNLTCPQVLGTYSSRLCLYISQFSQEGLDTLGKMSEREIEHELRRHLKVKEKIGENENPFSASAYIVYPSFEIPPIPTQYTNELTMWLRSVRLQCFFEPPLVKCSSMAFTQVKRKLMFYNSTKYPVTLSLRPIQSDTVNIKVSPERLTVLPHTEVCLKITLRFQKTGELEMDMKGVLELPFKTIGVYLPISITTTPPVLCQDVIAVGDVGDEDDYSKITMKMNNENEENEVTEM